VRQRLGEQGEALVAGVCGGFKEAGAEAGFHRGAFVSQAPCAIHLKIERTLAKARKKILDRFPICGMHCGSFPAFPLRKGT
jgi:hypothetical protein